MADLLSRSFDEEGNSLPEVMKEFHSRLSNVGLVGYERKVTTDRLQRLMCEEVETCTWQQLEELAVESWEETVPEESTAETREEVLEATEEDEELQQTWLGGHGRAYAKSAWTQGDDRKGQSPPKTRAVTRAAGRGATGMEEVKAEAIGGEEEGAVIRGRQPAKTDRRGGREEVVEQILQHRYHVVYGEQYKVKWEGYNNTFNSWVTVGDLHCPEVLAEFEEARKRKGAQPTYMTDAAAVLFYYGPLRTRSVFTDQGERPGRIADTESEACTVPLRKASYAASMHTARPAEQPIDNRPSSAYATWGNGFSNDEPAVATRGKGRGKGASGKGSSGSGRGATRQTWEGNDWFVGRQLADKVEAAAARTNHRRVELRSLFFSRFLRFFKETQKRRLERRLDA